MKRLFFLLFLIAASFSVNAQSQCGLNTFAYEIINDGDVFYISIEEPINIHEHFNVFINYIPQESEAGKFGPFKADCETFYTLSIYKKGFEQCNVTANIGSVCGTEECNIRDISVSYPECDPNGVVNVSLNFKYSNVSDSFKVKGNGQYYGEFAYADLPITLDSFPGDCSTEYEFIVNDSKYTNCGADIDNIIICCPINCGATAFEIVAMECSDEQIKMKLEAVEGLFMTNITVKINETYVNEFEVDSQYIYLSSALPLNSVLNTISVCNVGIAEVCCFTQTFSTDQCTGYNCYISDLEYNIPDCHQNTDIYIDLNFKYDNTPSDSFAVLANGLNYGVFSYASLPVSIGPFEQDCDTINEILVYDVVDKSCQSPLERISICCDQPCLEPIFDLVSMDCQDDLIFLKLELIHPLNNNQLIVNVNGDSINNYKLDYPYVYLEVPNNGVLDKIVQLCTPFSTNENCCYEQILNLENCNPDGECKISDIKVSHSQCNDAEIPHFILDFDHFNVGNLGFSVKGNGYDYGTYMYDELPIRIYIQDTCDLFYEFEVIDNEFNCSSSVEYGYFCCSSNCSFEINETRVKCDDGIINEIAFFLSEETDPIKNYTVYANGKLIGETSENNIFLEFPTEILLDGVNQIELTVCDNECCVTKRLDVSECYDDSQECSISNIEVQELTCSNIGLNFILDFEREGTTSNQFDVYSIFGYFGTYNYEDLPVKIENYPGIDFGLNAIFICDKGTLCCQAKLFTPPSCLILNPEGDETSSINAVQANDFKYIKQNPINSELIINSPVANTSYHLFNSAGQKVWSLKSNTLETILDANFLTGGMYLLRIENELGIKIEKLIIAK